MTEATLSYIVKVQDRDLKELKQQLKETNQTIGDSEKPTGRFSSALGSLGKTAAIAAGGAALGGLALIVKKSIDESVEHQKALAQTQAVIKSTGGAANVTANQILGLSNAIEKKTGVDDVAVQKGQNMLLTFTNIRNEAGKGNDVFNQATSILTDMSVAMGTDMSKQAIQLGKALNDPIKGVSALSKVGVTFTDQQKEQIKAMVESGNTMGAQKLIMGELNKEFGGSAEAMGKTLPGQIEILKAHLGDLEQNIGDALLPVISGAVSWIVANWPTISAVFGAVGEAIRVVFNNVVVPAVQFGVSVVRSMVDYIKQHWPEIQTTVEKVMTDVRIVIQGILTTIRTFWGTWGDTIMDIVKGVFNQVKIDIQTVVTVFRGVVQIIDGLIHGDWSEAWHGLQTIVKGVFTGIVSSIKGLVGTVLGAAADFGSAIFKGIVNALEGLGNKLESLILSPINYIIDRINGFGIHVGEIKVLGHTVFPGIDVNPFHIPHLATGGIVTSPTLALIGEAGPEAVVPLRGAGHGLGQTIIHVTVQGSVTSERELVDAIHYGLLAKQKRNTSLGLT